MIVSLKCSFLLCIYVKTIELEFASFIDFLETGKPVSNLRLCR